MDAKDLRIQPVQSESTHSHDGNINYASTASSIHYDKNKSYHGNGSNSLSKVDVQTSRPCAVIVPDRIVPAPAAPDPSIKRAHVVPWSFTRPPNYPPNTTDYQQQLTRNISPRQTYQENMPRHVLPPGYTAKLSEDMNVIEKNALASNASKSNLPHEVKYSEVPYNVSSLSSDPKSSRSSELPVNNQNPSLMRTHNAWPPGSNVRLTRPYAAPDLYQYPEYANCNAPRVLPIMRPHRTAAEEQHHMYPDPYHRGANIRYEPYPPAKDRYQQTRYDYIPSYSNPYAASHFMQKLPSNIPPHPYSGYPQTKYLDKVRDPQRDAYQRIPNPQGGYNVAYPNQGIHTNYGSIPGNCVQNKFYAYPSDANAHPAVPSKTQYIQNKSYVPHENFYPSEAPHQMKPQMMMPSYLPIHMQPLPSYPYYRKDPSMLPVKNYDFSQIKNIDPYTNQMSKVAPQFSPNIISPVESTTSSDVNHATAISPEDCGYVSQSSTASARSSDSAMNYYRALEHRYGHMQRLSAVSRSEDVRNEINKDSTGLDIRQFLQKWSDGDDEYSTGGSGSKEIVQAISIGPKNINQPKSDQDQLVVLDLVNVSNEDLGKYEHIEKVSKLPDNIKGYTSIDLLNQFEEVTRTRPPEKKEMQAKTAAFVHNMSTSLPSRPLSPLDVESKISQSIIHKDVGCNFEIKPCSPKMMNVELAAPTRTLIEEKIIEKVTNPVNENTPSVPPTIDKQTNNYYVTKNKNQRKSVSRRQENTANIPSCKMIQTPYSSTSVDNEKSSYSLQDLESNSGVCFASLPRLDNDIELSFPEVNQQFINDNKVEPSTVNADYKNLLTSNICSSENSSNDDTDKKILNNYLLSPTEKDAPRLSKYRKSKTSLEYVDTVSQANAQLTRKDSVIIKNPENQHFSDEKTVSSLNNVSKKTKSISFSKEYLPMNLAMSNATEFNVSTSQEKSCAFNGEFVENLAINLSQHVNPSASNEGLCSALNKITSRDKPPLTITNEVTRVLLEELESSTVIDRYQCEVRPHTSTSLLNSDQKVITTKNYQLPEGDGQPECSSVNKSDSEGTEVKSRNIKQNDRNTTTGSKEHASSKGKKINKNKIRQDVSTKCCDGSLAKSFEETYPLESSRSPSLTRTSKVSNDSDIHSNYTDVNARADIYSRSHLKNLSDDKILIPISTDSVQNKDSQDIEENNCNAHHSNCMSIESSQYDIVNNTAILRTNESACVPKENDHDTNESICSDHAESITTQSKTIDTQRIILNKSRIMGGENTSSVKSTKAMDFETKVNELDNLSNISKSDDSSYVLNLPSQDESENNPETVIAHAKINNFNSDTKVISLENTNCVQSKSEDHLDMKATNSFDQAAKYMTERATPDELVNGLEFRPEDARFVFSDVHQDNHIDFCDHPESIVISLENTNCVQNKAEDHLCMKTKNSVHQDAECMTERATPHELVNGPAIMPEDSRCVFSDVHQEEKHIDFCDHPESIITPAQTKIIELCIDTDIVKSNKTSEPSENEHNNNTGCVGLDGSICAPNEVDDYQDVKQNDNSEPTPKFVNADAAANELENGSGIITSDGSSSVHGEDHEYVENTLLAAKQSSEVSTCEPTIDGLDNDIRSYDSSVLNEIRDDSKENICSEHSPKSLAVNPSVTELVNDMVNSKPNYVLKKGQQNTINNVCNQTDTVVTTVERLSNNKGNNTNLVASDDSEKYFNAKGTQPMTAEPPANELKIATIIDETDNCLNDDLGSVQVSSPMAGNSSVIAELDESHRVQQENQQDANAKPYGYENDNKLINDSDIIESKYLVSNLENQLAMKEHESLHTENRIGHGTKNNYRSIINENVCGELFINSMDTGRPKSEAKIALEDCNKNTAANPAFKEHTKNIQAEQEVTKDIKEEQEAMKVIQKSIVSIDKNSNNESIDVTNEPSHMTYSHVTFPNSNLLTQHGPLRESKTEITEDSNGIENENDTTAEPFNFLDRRSKSPTLTNIDELPFHMKPDKFGSVSQQQIIFKFNEDDDLAAESHDDIGRKSKANSGDRTDVLNSSFYNRHTIDDNCAKRRSSSCFYKRMCSPIFQKLYNYQEGSCCRTLESISKISKLGNYIEDIAIGVIDDISSDYVVNEIEKLPIGIPHEEVYQNIKNMQRHFALIDKTNEDSLENYKTMEFMQKHTVRESAIVTKESKVVKNITKEPENISSCWSSELDHNHNPDNIKMIHLPEISESTTVAKEESSSIDIDLSINNISEAREKDDCTIKNSLDISKNKEIEPGPLKQKFTDIECFTRRKLKRSLSESSLFTYRNNTKDRLNESCNEIESLHGSNKRKKNQKASDEENCIPNIDMESVNYCSFLQNRRNSISTIYHDDDVSVCIFINDDCIITQEYDNETPSLEDIPEVNLQSIIETSIEEDIEEVEAENVPYHATEALLPDAFSVECIEERDAENWVEVACVETVVSDDIMEDDGDSSVDKSYSPNYENTVQPISEFDVYSDHTDKLKNIYGVGLCSNNFDLIKTLYTTPQMDVNKTLHSKESILECDNQYECSDIDNTTNTLSNCIENEMLCLHESTEENFILDTDQCEQDAFEVLGLSLSSTLTNSHTQAKDDIHSNAICVDDQLCDEPTTTCPPCKKTSSSPEVSSTTTEEKKSSILLKITNLNGSRTSHINNNNIAEDCKKIRCKFTENTDYSSCKSSTSRPLITKGAQKYIPPLKDTIHDLKVKLFLPQHRLKNLKYLKMTKDTKINHLTSLNLNSLKPSVVKKKAKPNFEDVLKSIDEIHIKKHKDKSKGVPKVIIKKTDSGSHYTSIPDNETFNPDMTGRKWQPWVFLEKNKFVDKMASRGKKNAVFCHRKNCYVLTENFKKYKSSSTKFVISQPSSKYMSTAPLRYTIKLKQS